MEFRHIIRYLARMYNYDLLNQIECKPQHLNIRVYLGDKDIKLHINISHKSPKKMKSNVLAAISLLWIKLILSASSKVKSGACN